MKTALSNLVKSAIRRFSFLREFAKRMLPYNIQLFVFSKVYEPEIYFLKKLLKQQQNGIAVDVGANQGLYTYFLAKKCKLSKVLAFEPNPTPFKILYDKTKQYNNVEIYNIGISDASEGTLTLQIPLDDRGKQITTRSSFIQSNNKAPYDEVDVPVATLDGLKLSNVVFIKIDVEGYEEFVLSGSMNTIKTNRPILLIETNLQEPTENVMRLFSIGYLCYYYERGNLHLIDMTNFPNSKRFVNIFFIPYGLQKSSRILQSTVR